MPVNSRLFLQFCSFIGVGGISTFVHYCVLFILVYFFGLRPVFSSSIGYVLSGALNYYLNYHVTFQSDKPHHRALLKFILIAVVGLFINTLIMALCTEMFTLHYMVAQILATGIVAFWNFSGNRYWSF